MPRRRNYKPRKTHIASGDYWLLETNWRGVGATEAEEHAAAEQFAQRSEEFVNRSRQSGQVVSQMLFDGDRLAFLLIQCKKRIQWLIGEGRHMSHRHDSSFNILPPASFPTSQPEPPPLTKEKILRYMGKETLPATVQYFLDPSYESEFDFPTHNLGLHRRGWTYEIVLAVLSIRNIEQKEAFVYMFKFVHGHEPFYRPTPFKFPRFWLLEPAPQPKPPGSRFGVLVREEVI